jgi:hypothetical protein
MRDTSLHLQREPLLFTPRAPYGDSQASKESRLNLAEVQSDSHSSWASGGLRVVFGEATEWCCRVSPALVTAGPSQRPAPSATTMGPTCPPYASARRISARIRWRLLADTPPQIP